MKLIKVLSFIVLCIVVLINCKNRSVTKPDVLKAYNVYNLRDTIHPASYVICYKRGLNSNSDSFILSTMDYDGGNFIGKKKDEWYYIFNRRTLYKGYSTPNGIIYYPYLDMEKPVHTLDSTFFKNLSYPLSYHLVDKYEKRELLYVNKEEVLFKISSTLIDLPGYTLRYDSNFNLIEKGNFLGGTGIYKIIADNNILHSIDKSRIDSIKSIFNTK